MRAAVHLRLICCLLVLRKSNSTFFRTGERDSPNSIWGLSPTPTFNVKCLSGTKILIAGSVSRKCCAVKGRSSLKERLVADWLTKAGERGGIDVALCQILLAQGCRILKFGHGPTEAGKDIIAFGKDGDLRAYQVKSGPIDLAKFERGLGQVTMLVEAAVSHPNVRNGQRHRPFLVTSGSFSDPVQSLVRSMNESWQQRGLQPLTLIGGPQLHGDFMKLSSDFWPVEPPNVRDFLSLYLAEGKGDLDRKGFAAFLRSFFPEDRSSPTTVIERRIAAAALFGSYVLEAFYRNADHWSIFSGWIMVAAYQAWIAE